jgi:alpha-ketoglutarate-dependent 2,4-dichlorophenoxyacetate dioxygenase
MLLNIRSLQPSFVGEVVGVDLRPVHDRESLDEIRAGMDRFAVLVFREQPFTDPEQLAFAQRFDGALHANTGAAALGPNRFGNEALADISNVDEDGQLLRSDDRRRMYALGNRLWHTDASFQDPAGRYSMLSARVVPPVRADTEFADMRGAYDALDADTKARIEGLRAHHSIAYSRQTLGFEFSEKELDKLRGAVHPLVRTNPRTGRPALYLASHASRIIDWPLPEGRLLLRPDRARDPAAVRLPAQLARRRPGDLGQPRDDASRTSVRRRQIPPGAAARHNAGCALGGGGLIRGAEQRIC